MPDSKFWPVQQVIQACGASREQTLFKDVYCKKEEAKQNYSDNGSTFVGAAGCLRKTISDEKFSQSLPRTKSSVSSTLVSPLGGVDNLRG